jgi:pyruvate dehydrogenase E1 component beta subunit
MAVELKMPALSPTMEEGTLAKWLVKEGDQVGPGDILAEIETDKATMEFEAIDEGTVGKILVAEGTENVAVGTVIAMLSSDDDDDASEAEPAAAPAASPDTAGEGKDIGQEPSKAEITKPVQAAPERDPEIPHGTNMATVTVRDALRDAMAEEMRRDDRVFVMGEDSAPSG